jgi:hypothetical protein
MNRDYPLAESPNPGPGPKKISVKRAYEIADSLDKEAFNKFNAARIRFKGESDESAYKLSKEINESRRVDEANAKRYRSLADKASKNK